MMQVLKKIWVLCTLYLVAIILNCSYAQAVGLVENGQVRADLCEIGDLSLTNTLLDETSLSGAEHPDIDLTGNAEVKNGRLTATTGKTFLRIGQADWRNYVAQFNIRLDRNSGKAFHIDIAAPKDAHVWHRSELRLDFERDKDGAVITVTPRISNINGKYYIDRSSYKHLFRPIRKGLDKQLEQRGLEPGTWYDRELSVRIECLNQVQRVWFEGRMVYEHKRPHRAYGPILVSFAAGDSLSKLKVLQQESGDSMYIPVPLNLYLNDKSAAGVPTGAVAVNDVPFLVSQSKSSENNLFLKNAGWVEHKQDPSSYYGNYELGEWFAGDPSRPFFRVPADDYAAIWLLAATEPNTAFSENISFRLGYVSQGRGRYVLHDFQTTVPRSTAASGKHVVKTIKTKVGNLFLMRIPIGIALTQDFDEHMTLDVSKGLKLAVRQPDPCRFRIRPLGVPSGVRIFGMTLERSPVRLAVTSSEPGHIFNQPQEPWFAARLENQSDVQQTVVLKASAADSAGAIKTFECSISLLPFAVRELPVRFPELSLGHYALEVDLLDTNGKRILRRSTTFALLPEDTRDRTVRAPWGTWNFNGVHMTPKDIGVWGSLMRKLGIRFTLAGTDEGLARYGLRNNDRPRTQAKGCSKALKNNETKYPNGVKHGLIFHEDAISGEHVTRFPDCLLGRSPYQFNEAEQKRFDQMWQNALDAAEETRKNFPDFKLDFGNGNAHLVEEFLRRGFPKKYIDSIGNENCGFMRPPEAQPDIIGFSTLWIFKEIMKHYGYDDIPLDICYEWMAHSTNPGNLTEKQQADYYVRDGLLGLAWGLKFINPSIITDAGNGYYYSNWGSSGFCNRSPEVNPKPSYVAFATLTLMLDKARFVRHLDTGSTGLFCLEFRDKNDDYLYALWAARGRRELNVTVAEDTTATLTDWEARTTKLAAYKRALAFTVGTAPVYLTVAEPIKKVVAKSAAYDTTPPAKAQLISRLDKSGDWTIEPGRNMELETHNFSCPRRKGNLAFSDVAEFEGAARCIKVDPGKPDFGTAIQPMYAVMALKQPVTLKGMPREIGLMINGNSGWGRVMFELEDARGQRWISIGASQDGTPTRWMADWLPAEALANIKESSVADWNTNDSEIRSSINFDGWRYVSFPLPGQYPGEGFHWPRNCWWKSDKDGKVHYPLTFKKLIIELREKVVYIKDMVKPARDDIYIKNLMVGE